MDSKAVNKLIRSEIWPLLRDQGFSKFESRTAFRYRGSFINVVNFQSFNSYLAAGVGCTTFSFGLNLGVYVLGSAGEHILKRDGSGLLLPREYECSFRASLKKRTPVDGFAREDIFYIDPAGHSAAPCFHEVRHLLTEVAPQWFETLNDLDGLISWMGRSDRSSTDLLSDNPANRFPISGSYVWHDLFALLLLLKHAEAPTPQSAEAAFREIERAIGTVQDFSAIIETAASREVLVARIRELWERLGSFAPLSPSRISPISARSSLVGPAWSPLAAESMSGPNGDGQVQRLSIREHLWPILRSQGFSEFTDRLAHRIAKDSIHVVEVVPMDPAERKTWGLPEGLFRVGVGIFWPAIKEDRLFRTNRDGNPRPKATECHLTDWLIPERRRCTKARSAFDSPEGAQESLAGTAVQWFTSFATAESGLAILQQDDWEIFWCFPMMGGYGAKSSTRRFVYLATLAVRLHKLEEVREYLRLAEKAIDDWYPEHLRPRYRKWFDGLKANLVHLTS